MVTRESLQCRQQVVRLLFPIRVREDEEQVARIGELALDLVLVAQDGFGLDAAEAEARDLHRDLRRIEPRRAGIVRVLRAKRPEPVDLVDGAAQLLCEAHRPSDLLLPHFRHLQARDVERG